MPDTTPDGKPSKELSTTEAPKTPAVRTLTIPKALKDSARRMQIASVVAKQEKKFDALDDASHKSREDRLSRSREIRSFKATERNRKDEDSVVETAEKTDSTPVETKPAAEKAAPQSEVKIEKTETKESTEKAEKTTDTPAGDKAEKKTEAPADNTSGLPDEHVRSLKAFGVSDEDITEGLKSNPAMMASMAKMMHAARKKEIEEFANIGRAKSGQKPEKAQIGTPAVPTPQSAPVQIGPVSRVNVDEIAKKFGITDPALLKAIIEPMNAMADQLNAAHHHKQQQDIAATQKRVDNFFAAPSLSAYAEDYKVDAAREKVIEHAAWILNGATAAGKKLALEEALQMAHDMTAAPKAKTAARAELVDEAKKRAAGVTQKPSGQQTESASNKPRNRAELMKKIGARLNAL